MIDGKYMHTYIHTHVFDDVHFRKTYQSDILFPPSKILETDFGSSYKKSFEYTGNCVRGYTKCGLIYAFVRAGFR